MPVDLTTLSDFGKIEAEEDPVTDYFVTTQAHTQISSGKTLLVLGRKGSGKTALVRALTEQPARHTISRPLNFRQYPWTVHQTRIDAGASPVEAYIASWEFFIAVQLASLLLKRLQNLDSTPAKQLIAFLRANYGGIDADAAHVLVPDSLRIEGSLEPAIFGNKLGRLDLKRTAGDVKLGRELTVLSASIFDAVAQAAESELGGDTVLLHFDELDHGLSTLDESRAHMLIGLVLAARQVKRRFEKSLPVVCPVVYLRTDLWEDFDFSDKNKITETHALTIEWTPEQLKHLIEERARVKLQQQIKWRDLEDGQLMRGSQAKWDHICSRTYLRPRDVIRFCNTALTKVKERQPAAPTLFTNKDVVDSRADYSQYLKRELDDEVKPHWPDWTIALDTLSALQTLTFDVGDFEREYAVRRKQDGPPAAEALELLFHFSVIGYEQSSGYGGRSWVFRYHRAGDVRWDPGAKRCKVHPGLKEYANLREERRNTETDQTQDDE